MVLSVRNYQHIHPRDRAEWRSWLEENHDSSSGVWVIYYKKAIGKRSLNYEEAVEEALSFGWIDSLADAIDEERYKQLFTPRKKGSVWAKTNKRRVGKLVKEGRMTPAGLAKVEEAKADGSWNQLDAVDRMIVPDELAEALRSNPAAEKNFRDLSVSKKKQFIWYLVSAKRPETRERRIAEIVCLAAEDLSMEDRVQRKKSSRH
jgi:uncharacterized protein YdeI (YjbR/CyaY-like superfamily)